ncbi:hypothetical protein [Bradyrhizobium pachyrhizi]|uniref:hypothetical protein n=1 Tax=Bradyrhizobium pachyrhizi TaxID=280333 RepID=UPI00067C2912|nr:hypothetical protein [Bradyrhizobium pachyrhizi]
MEFAETKYFRESWESDQRLNQLQVTRQGLLEVRDVAMQERSNATNFHPTNSPGTFGYHHGTWALRDRFVGDHWDVDRSDGIEAIWNEELKIKIAFCNVDLACNDEHVPKPRSEKGAGAERASGTPLFGKLPQFAPRQAETSRLYYLMVDQDGAAELTRPVVSGGTFTSAVERIYLSRGMDEDPSVVGADDNGPVDNFDPQVVRK